MRSACQHRQYRKCYFVHICHGRFVFSQRWRWLPCPVAHQSHCLLSSACVVGYQYSQLERQETNIRGCQHWNYLLDSLPLSIKPENAQDPDSDIGNILIGCCFTESSDRFRGSTRTEVWIWPKPNNLCRQGSCRRQGRFKLTASFRVFGRNRVLHYHNKRPIQVYRCPNRRNSD